MALGTYRVVLGPRLKETPEEWAGLGSEAEMADVGETEATAEAVDVRMSETANMTTIGTQTGTETEMVAQQQKLFHPGRMAPSKWTPSVRAVRDTLVVGYCALGLNLLG
jgi:hypothetical protein